MATQQQPPGLEIIPSKIELQDAVRIHEYLNSLEGTLAEYRTKILDWKVVTKDDCINLKQMIADMKRIPKDAEASIQPLKTMIDRAKSIVQTRFLRVKNAHEQIHVIASQKVTEWERAEAQAAEQERKRIQEQMDRDNAEKARQKKAQDEAEALKRKTEAIAQIDADLKAKKITKREAQARYKAAGAQHEADLLQASITEEQAREAPREVKVTPQKTAVAGTKRTVVYKARCIDRIKFLNEFCRRYSIGDTSMLEFVEVSDDKLSGKAREVKNKDKMGEMFPGIEATEEVHY